MSKNQIVRGTQDEVPFIEVNKDTVYKRYENKTFEEDGILINEYKEEQIPKDVFISSLLRSEDFTGLTMIVSTLMSEIDTLQSKINEMKEGS